jgi:glycolate oxidase iron-sulfur subunit
VTETAVNTGSYDPQHPPSQDLLDDCVHCGFCLPTCPTYVTTGEEMESPRGRIYLMDLAARGEIPLDEAFGEHIDSCLGCLACVTSCPSGVAYDKLIESVRPQVERNVPRSRLDRAFRELVFAVFPHPARLRLAALGGLAYQRSGLRAALARRGLTGKLPAGLRAMEGLLPPVRLRELVTGSPTFVAARPPRRTRVALLPGCAQRVFFSPANAATARVLSAEGADVVMPRDEQCCGALSIHSGREAEGLEMARRTIALVERQEVDAVVANVAGCGSAMKEYAHLLADDPAWADRAAAFSAKVVDVSELLAGLEPAAVRHPVPMRVAYHDACHLANAQQIRTAPRQVLSAIPGLELLEVPEAEICCGSAGVYNLVQPESGDELGKRKAENLRAAAPDVIATANAGCLLQIRRHLGEGVPLVHPVQLLDAAINGTPLPRG